MKNLISFGVIFVLLSSVHAARAGDQETITLSGTIGKKSVEMEISSSDRAKGTFEGRYHFTGKTEYLLIRGEVYDDCIYMEQYSGHDTTGFFYLQKEGDSLKGTWVYQTNWQKVRLLTVKTLAEYSAATSTAIKGTYGTGGNWINDYWFTEEDPRLEIGFNGGYVVIEEMGRDSLGFQLEVICGPTYHFAIAGGLAIREGAKYVYHGEEDWNKECVITLTFNERSVYVVASESYNCGFGARAYLDHDFVKICDDALFGDNTSLGSIKGYVDNDQ
jgi:hypothetical protein